MLSSSDIRVALFGESSAGKSHYGGQLLSRIQIDGCELTLRDAPTDISLFNEVRAKLNSGLLAAHTPSSVYRESIWPVVDSKGQTLDLSWPDYGGEQVTQLIEKRVIAEEWLKRVQSADGWMLMVRPHLCKQDDDIFSRPLSEVSQANDNGQSLSKRSTQARMVELLQMLMHARNLHESKPIPVLSILLSCWDELGLADGTKPIDVLRSKMPLLASYVDCKWGNDMSSVLGLSALGCALSTTIPNEEFINKGPEKFGFIVDENGERTKDLTMPIVKLAAALN
jgi:hypothetical protein